jgi:hypothetical protein
MRRVRRTIRPLLRTATVMWLWQHRHQIPGAVRFLREAPARWQQGERRDLLTEARLRVKLASDPRTREHDVLTSVRNGVAFVAAGTAASAAAADIARRAAGVREVDLASAPVVTTSSIAATDAAASRSSLAKLAG